MVIRTAPQSWLTDCLAKLDRLSKLQPNWDSYGAFAVKLESIAGAKRALTELARDERIVQPLVNAVPDGHAVLMWEQNGREFEAEFLPDGSIAFLYTRHDDPSADREGVTRDVHEIASMLLRL